MGIDDQMHAVLASARARGEASLIGSVIPQSLDKFSVYTGLLQSFLELGKLAATEDRDLKAIGVYHELELTRIQAALTQVEAAMLLDFENDERLRASTFESINMLIAVGQYEVAAEFHKRLLENLSRPALQTIVESRNDMSGPVGTKWIRR